jgi:hypothetical protein
MSEDCCCSEKLDAILAIVKDLQVRQKAMEERQKTIKTEVEEAAPPVVGSFGTVDTSDK